MHILQLIYEDIIKNIKFKYDINIPNGKFMRIDVLIYLYINYLHIGTLLNGDALLCFDEAQDYNLIEYIVLLKVNKGVIMNLYGDNNQSIYAKGIGN